MQSKTENGPKTCKILFIGNYAYNRARAVYVNNPIMCKGREENKQCRRRSRNNIECMN